MTLAALAVVVRVLIPQGFMVSAEGGHGAEIVLCSGKTVVAPDAYVPHPAPAQDKSDHSEACPFAGHGLAGPLPDLAEAGPVVFTAYEAEPPAPLAVRPQLQPVGPPLPARGPPTSLI